MRQNQLRRPDIARRRLVGPKCCLLDIALDAETIVIERGNIELRIDIAVIGQHKPHFMRCFKFAALIGGEGGEEIRQRRLLRLERQRAGQTAEQNRHLHQPGQAQSAGQAT
mgnify:FL=1